MSDGNQGCPVCKGRATILGAEIADHPGRRVTCPRCGHYEYAFVPTALGLNHPPNASLLPYLSAYIRQNQPADGRALRIGNDWTSRAETHRATTVPQKLDKLLRYFTSRSTELGRGIVVKTFTLAPWCDGTDGEALYLYHALVERGSLVQLETNPEGGICQVTPRGWEEIAPSTGAGVPGTVFVAMSYNPELLEAYLRGIEPALTDCGFRVIRVDREEHNENILDKIIADLRTAQFMVADFTGHRNGVYFEAGFARGLGRDVVWTCRSDDVKNAHFDTRVYNYVRWNSPEELRELLTARVRATIAGARLI